MNQRLNRHAQRLKLALLGARDLLVSLGPVLLLGIGLLVAAYWWLDPQPPKHVRLATGPEGSAYANFGKRYQAELARNGITVELLPTEGALDNLAKLREGSADIGFVRGGLADPEADEELGIRSLGSLFYEPIWVIYRRDVARRVHHYRGAHADELTRLTELKGLRVNVDLAGSGVPQIMEKLLAANHMKPTDLKLAHLDPTAAAKALESGKLDALVMASAPQSRLVRAMLHSPQFGLMGFEQSEAYARRLPFLSAVTLPRALLTWPKTCPLATSGCWPQPRHCCRTTIPTPRCASSLPRRHNASTVVRNGSTQRVTFPTPTPASCLSPPRVIAPSTAVRPSGNATCRSGPATLWSACGWCSVACWC